ncbi:MAG: hypothetical protein FJ197_12540 [Gammaproteobacteria bacterium]|nr:hypothetical protein [Gammaproteobacteria bacterium]
MSRRAIVAALALFCTLNVLVPVCLAATAADHSAHCGAMMPPAHAGDCLEMQGVNGGPVDSATASGAPAQTQRHDVVWAVMAPAQGVRAAVFRQSSSSGPPPLIEYGRLRL